MSCSWLLEKASYVERSSAIDAEVQNGGRTRCLRSKVVTQPAGQSKSFLITSAPGDGVTEHDDSRDCIIHHRCGCDLPSCAEVQSDSARHDQEKQGRHQPSHTGEYGVGWSGFLVRPLLPPNLGRRMPNMGTSKRPLWPDLYLERSVLSSIA